jgi:hypothetical protein
MLRSFAPSRSVAAAMIALAAASASAAQTDTTIVTAPAPRGPLVGFVVELSGEFGGDVLGTLEFTDGESQDLTAGTGGSIAVGAQIRPTHASPLALRATVGYKYESATASNTDLTVTRIPVEVIASYDVAPGFWIGAGVVHHSGVKFDAGELGEFEFDPATGATAEVGWKVFALSYTSLTYRHESGEEFDASSLGLTLTFTFGRGQAARR